MIWEIICNLSLHSHNILCYHNGKRMEDNDRIKREQKTDREELLSNCKHASPDSGLEAPFIGKSESVSQSVIVL